MQAKQRVSVPRRSQLAGSPACCTCDARSTVAQDVRTGDPGPQQPGIRGMSAQTGGCWSPTSELTGEQRPGSRQIVKSDRIAQTKEIGRRSVFVLAGNCRCTLKHRVAKPSEIWLLIPNRDFDDPRFARFQRLSASIGRFLKFISDQSSLTGHARASRTKPGASTFIDRSHLWQALYLTNEACEQRRGIVPSPRQSERQRYVQIDHW